MERPHETAARSAPGRTVDRGVVSLGVVAFLGGLLAWMAGRRGLFAFDQSILFDAGHRVLSGQVPFRDFVAPLGPMAFWFQGACFALFGVDWAGYLWTGALLNASGVVVVFFLVRSLLPGETWPALLAAGLTGVWLVPPSGTPWVDDVGFVAGLGALAVLGRTGVSVGGRAVAPAAISGVLLVAALLTKQNVAIGMLLPVLAMASRAPGSVSEILRRLAPVGVGAALALGLFGAWLFLYADPDLFVQHVIRLPLEEGSARLLEDPARTALTLATGAGPRPVRVALLVAMAPVLPALAGRGRDNRLRFDLAVIAASYFLGQNLFLATANNQPEISLPFVGLVAALGARLAWSYAVGEESQGTLESSEGSRAAGRTLLAAASIVVVTVCLAWLGVDAALSRRAHDVFARDTRFERAIDARGLEGLRWGDSTRLLEGWRRDDVDGWESPKIRDGGPVRVEAFHMEELLSRLRAEGEEFFVFPDWTLLYGLVGSPSPQPLLWFHPGLTYPWGGDPELDRWIVSELEGHGVVLVVLEEVSWLGTRRRLRDFPALDRWIRECFRNKASWGGFRLLRRENDCPTRMREGL